MGLRQVLPVQTKRMVFTLGGDWVVSGRVATADMPGIGIAAITAWAGTGMGSGVHPLHRWTNGLMRQVACSFPWQAVEITRPWHRQARHPCRMRGDLLTSLNVPPEHAR